MFFFICIILFLTFIHELGHLLTARWVGVKAEEFAVGFGPNLLTMTDKYGTIWSINLIPLGGYVSFGNDNISEVDAMIMSSPLKRTFYALGGPLFNILFFFIGSVFLLYIVGLEGHVCVVDQNTYYVAANGFVVHKYSTKDVVFENHHLIKQYNLTQLPKERYFIRGIWNNISYSIYVFKRNIISIYDLIIKKNFQNVKSIIGINKMLSSSIETKNSKKEILFLILHFLVQLSLSLGLYNLLPFIPLDGFWVLFSIFDVFLSLGKMSQRNKRILVIVLNFLSILGFIVLNIPLIKEIIMEIPLLCAFFR